MSRSVQANESPTDPATIIPGTALLLHFAHTQGKLFLGSRSWATNEQVLRDLNITSILAITMNPVWTRYEGITYKTVFALDQDTFDITSLFAETHEFIDRTSSHGACYVHCDAGISRSATIIISYLMKKESKDFETILKFVESSVRSLTLMMDLKHS